MLLRLMTLGKFGGCLLISGLFVLAIAYRPCALLLGWTDFEAKHGAWPEVLILLATIVFLKESYRLFFQNSKKNKAIKEIINESKYKKIKQTPFFVRILFLIIGLIFFLLSVVMQRNIVISFVTFLVFSLSELSHVLFVGDSLLYDPKDEMQEFFKLRALRVGYFLTIICALIVIILLCVSKNIALYVSPILLTVGLLVPNIMLSYWNRKAELSGDDI